MLPLLAVKDHFFHNPLAARERVLSGSFDAVESPEDGVTYTGINLVVPESVKSEFITGLEEFVGRIQVNALFARIMRKGECAPKKLHSDRIMGDVSAHVYLSLDWPEGSGTSFYTHESEGAYHTELTDLSKIDTGSFASWSRYLLCQARFNRIVMHDADAWHSADPAEGFGDRPENARLVLTCFFNMPVEDE